MQRTWRTRREAASAGRGVARVCELSLALAAVLRERCPAVSSPISVWVKVMSTLAMLSRRGQKMDSAKVAVGNIFGR